MGRALSINERKLALKVLKFFESEKRNGCYFFPVEQVFLRAVAATGYSRNTLLKMKKEAEEIESQPPESKRGPNKPKDPTKIPAKTKKSKVTKNKESTDIKLNSPSHILQDYLSLVKLPSSEQPSRTLWHYPQVQKEADEGQGCSQGQMPPVSYNVDDSSEEDEAEGICDVAEDSAECSVSGAH